MTLSWGIAATGRIARTVGSVIAAHPDMRVAAVGSRSLERAAGLAAELGEARSYGSYEELVQDPEVQAVYVATPHAQHADVVEVALRAGRAVLCEKPLTASLAETERLTALAHETGTFLMEAMWMRFNPLVQRLAETVRSGGLGEIRSVHASFGFVAPFDATARLWDPQLGGGALLDLGVYPIDLARLLLGDPALVACTGSMATSGVDAEATVQLGWHGGAGALLDISLVAALPGTALVIGTRGYAELSPTFHAPTQLVVRVDGGSEVVHDVPHRDVGFVGEIEEVARCVAAGRGESEVLPLTETIATMRVIDEAGRLLRRAAGA
jgi:predicted dehydrogenase